MSNVLKVSLQTTIYSLADRGWSQRRIASELGINRETVRWYLRRGKPAISIAGSEEEEERKPGISNTGDQADVLAKVSPASRHYKNGPAILMTPRIKTVQ